MRGRIAVAVLLLAACGREPAIERVPPGAYKGPSTTPPATPSPTGGPRVGAREPGCVNGWGEPTPGEPAYDMPLAALRSATGVKGAFRVGDLRYFIGPDDPTRPPDERQRQPVERWYGKVVSRTDPSFRVRFLVERRKDAKARLVAAAAYPTAGFESPEWYGFRGTGARQRVRTLPGTWAGRPYDYVKAGALPDEVVGCLSD
jgi:hypothetical protein